MDVFGSSGMIRGVSKRPQTPGRPQSPAQPNERDQLERLLGRIADPREEIDPVKMQVVGRQDELPTWLVENEWRIFARPARELMPGGQEIAQFELPGGEVLSASFDPARNSVQLPFDLAEAYVNYV